MDDLRGLLARRRPQVDALEIEVTERLQGSRRGFGHPDPPGLFDCCEHGVDEHADLLRPSGPHDVAHGLGQVVGDKDAGAHRVFEVVAHVGDAIGPGDDLAFRRARRRGSIGKHGADVA